MNETIWPQLEPLGLSIVPYLRDTYSRYHKWQGRNVLVHHAIKFSRESDDAFQLGLMALQDRSKNVIYSACMLLAYSLREDAPEPLRNLLNHKDQRVIAGARAAIDAIQHRNHSGKVFLIIKPLDR